jgi:hypothetical protein
MAELDNIISISLFCLPGVSVFKTVNCRVAQHTLMWLHVSSSVWLSVGCHGLYLLMDCYYTSICFGCVV